MKYYLLLSLLIFSCNEKISIIGNIENEGIIYRAMNDYFTIKALNDHFTFKEENIFDKNLQDAYVFQNQFYFSDIQYEEFVLLKKRVECSDLITTFENNLDKKAIDMIRIYYNESAIDSLKFFTVAYSGKFNHKTTKKNITNCYSITLICCSDKYSFAITYFDSLFPKVTEEEFAIINQKKEHNLFEFYKNITINKKYYNYNFN